MIEKSLVYIHAVHGARRFIGCGVLVEGPYVATCRHVWRMATEAQSKVVADSVEIEFPHAYRQSDRVRVAGRLADACESKDGPPLDLVLLSPDDIPSGIMPLQLAFDPSYEIGDALAVVGLTGRNPADPALIEDVTIEGRLADKLRGDGRRQFTGENAAAFWLERGSSGSPVFLRAGQHVAGILSLSELGANSGKSHLHEAFVVRGQVIRGHVVRLIAQSVARTEQIDLSELREILATIGAQDVSVAEIPQAIRQFIESSRAHAAEQTPPSNLGNDIDAAIEASRALVGQFKPEEALSLVRAKIAEERKAFTLRTIPLLKEQAAVQRIAFDSAGARTTRTEITRLDPTDVWSWFDLGDLWMIAGDSTQAARAYRSAQEAATRSGETRDLSVSHDKIGDVLVAQGDGPGALNAYRAGRAIRETLAARDPANTEWQRDLSVSHERIGDVLIEQGEDTDALASYKIALLIAEMLAARDPANTEWQRDLSGSHDRIGNVLIRQGDSRGAFDAYLAGHAIREALAARDPANIESQRDLSIGHVKIGDVLVALGDGPRALDAYRAGHAIREALAARDPENTYWQRDLSVSHERIGNLLIEWGDSRGAFDAYWAGHAIREALAARDPANTEWQRDLIVSYVKLSVVSPEQAREHLRRAASIAGRLHETGRLNPVDHWMIDDLAGRIAALVDDV